MSKMRLTTLNLDDQCTQILSEEKNKSRYAREAIKMYPRVVNDLDELEDTYIAIRNAYDALAKALVESYAQGHTIEDFIADFTEHPAIFVSRAHDAGHLRSIIRSAASLHGNPSRRLE